jgi:hypothetical protein
MSSRARSAAPDARVCPAHEGVFTARPDQMYDGTPPCPSELAWPTVAEATDRVRYWRSPHEYYADRPLESTYVYPAAVGEKELLRMALEQPLQHPLCPPLEGEQVPADQARLLPAHAELLATARRHPALAAGRQLLERGGADADALIRQSLLYAVRVVGSGIFVRITNGQLQQFIPFTTWDATNRWGPRLSAADGTPEQFVERLAQQTHRPLHEFITDPSHWIAGSGDVVGVEQWTGRAVSGKVAEFAYLLWLTLSRYRVPDCVFIYNRRDTPVVRANPEHHPHFHLFDNMEEPLSADEQLLHAGGAIPFLSEATIAPPSNGVAPHSNSVAGDADMFSLFADVPVPTQDDVCLGSGLAFVHSKKQVVRPPDLSAAQYAAAWKTQRPTAVFRGAATGAGTDDAVTRSRQPANYNQRLVVARMSAQCAVRRDCAPDGVPLLNAGITSYNARPRKTYGYPLSMVNIRRLGLDRATYLDAAEQKTFRYHLYIDGHSVAFRLPSIMLSGHLVLYVASRVGHTAWWSPLLTPNVHYVPVRSDLSNLLEQVLWCRKNDAAAQKIAAAGRAVMLELFPPPVPAADRHQTAAAGSSYLTAYMAATLRAIAPRPQTSAAASKPMLAKSL